MDGSIAAQLSKMNRDFYDGFSAEFARSRSRLHPGIESSLADLPEFDTLLDVGCGDGRVGRALVTGQIEGLGEWEGEWTGVDSSRGLLAEGAKVGPTRQVDLDIAGWAKALPRASYDAVVCYSVLHHIASEARRFELVQEMADLLRPGGGFAFSVWQLMHLERFQKRVRPWSDAGLKDSDIEPGDLLLDWKMGGEALRYVHQFEPEELTALCDEAGLDVESSFRSDGETGDLGLYVVGRRPD